MRRRRWGSEAERQPLVVADGMGVDSTAMLLFMWQNGVRPDLILHADTGGEHPDTVAYIPERRRWLASVGFPDVVVVRAPTVFGKLGTYSTLEENCLVNATLPSLAFGRKACSKKWKRAPQDAYVRRWAPAREAWARGDRVVKCIGYDAGPKDARRSLLEDDARFQYIYPLRLVGWDRERCAEEILRAGLRLPRKSACFFCPSAKPWEIAQLVEEQPDLADRIVAMEARAKPGLRKIDGLWRKPVFGKRKGSVAHPGTMTEFIEQVRADPELRRRHLAVLNG